MSELSIFEKLALSTVRIECEAGKGKISTGTGFFMKFVDNKSSFVPAIITNKHVLEGAKRGFLYLTLSNGKGRPLYNGYYKFEITNFEQPWLNHPDPAIDLCAMPINALVNDLTAKQLKPYITFLEFSNIPTQEDIDDMIGMENVVMIGYPNGLWDERHNQPVLRSGVLASHYRFDWNNKPEFLIDLACVPGSSGSPVLIVDMGQVNTRKGLNIGSTRVKFLGVLYAGPVLTANGAVEVVPVPTNHNLNVKTQIPINLGYVIKANKLSDFEKIFQDELAKVDS